MKVMNRIGAVFVAFATALVCATAMLGAAQATETVEAQSAAPVTTVEAQSATPVTQATLSSDQKTITAQAYGGNLAASSLVKFAVWSDNKGQDDLRWYTAKKSGAVWTAQIPVSNHKDAGLYKIDAFYRVPGSTTEKGLGRSTVTVSAPTATAATLSQTEDQKSQGMFTITVSGISSPSGVQRVQIPTWSANKGQDDLVWYEAKRNGATWSVEVPCVGAKRSPGTYIAHVYVTCGNGVVAVPATMTADAVVGPVKKSATLSSDQKTITAQAYGGNLAASSLVKFAVWSDNKGQDDLRWYTAKKSGAVWTAQIPVSNHKDAGLYKIDAFYRVPGSTTEKGLGRSTVTVSAPTAKVNVTASGNGFYKVGISGVSSPSGVAAVEVPTWTAKNGQDDLIWHKTGRDANGWYSVLDACVHKGEDGAYISHIYVTCGNGVKAAVGVINFNVKAQNYVYVTGANGSGMRNVWIKNPTSTNGVKAAAWSATGGQDDLKWYNAVNKGSNLYQITVNCKNLKHTGNVKVHVYANNNHIATTNFSAVAADLPDQKYSDVDRRIAWMGSNTNYLIAVDTSKCFVRIYQGWAGNWKPVKTFACAPGKSSTPTVKGQFTIQNKGYVFGSGYSCYYWTQFYGNYLFHSILYNPGTFSVQDGTMGRPVSHGCVRLNIENAKWIQDVIPRGTKVYVF